MRKIEVRIRQIIWAAIQSFKPTTYDFVMYKGNKFYIKSSLSGESVWHLYQHGIEQPKYSYIKGSELKIVHSLDRFVKVFKQHLDFQKGSWGLIDCCKPIGRRLCYYSSENIKF